MNNRERLERFWSGRPRYVSGAELIERGNRERAEREETMRCVALKVERYENGQVKRITDAWRAEYNPVQAENMSESAIVVSLERGIGGLATIYEDRRTRQAIIDGEMLEALAMEKERRRAQSGEREGWVS